MSDSGITVSIFMLAYNQEEFISQAIEGVLAQEVDFRTELVIGEDCSTDSTRDICQLYADKYPEKIKLILNKSNIGIGANYVRTYSFCTGKYIAICDGDDYWIDSLKLQKQLDFLEENQDYKIIYTNNYNLFPSGELSVNTKDNRPETTSFNNLIFENYITSVTVLFKNTPLTDSLSKLIQNMPYGDWPTYLLVTHEGGKIYFLNQTTAVYRRNFGTSTSLRQCRTEMSRVKIKVYKNLKRESIFINKNKIIRKSLLQQKTNLMASYNKESKFIKSLLLAAELIFKMKPFHIAQTYLYSLKRTVEQRKTQ